MLFEKISYLYQSCSTPTPLFPPTELYNEGWLLRLVLDWFATHDAPDHPLHFPAETRWFSEARLPTAFASRHKNDQLAEKRTRADGVIGHFEIGGGTKTGLRLVPEAQHFVVLEAKMFAPLAPGIKNVHFFDQTARSVACIAEVLSQANRYPVDMTLVGYYVLAPRIQIERGIFAEYLNRESIHQKIKQRANAYNDKKMKQWYSEWVEPTLEQIVIDMLSWEDVLAHIKAHDALAGPFLETFYEQCVQFHIL